MIRPGIRSGIIAAAAAVTLVLFAPAPALHAEELSCEGGDNAEGGCCCFQKAHTYLFEPKPVSRLEVTFDTGRGLGCQSQVTIQLLRREGWKTLRTVNASSSNGRSQVNRLSGAFVLGDTIAGVRIDDGGRCYIDYSKVVFEPAEGGTADVPPADQPPGPDAGAEVGLANGEYRLDAYSSRRHESVWEIENDGGKISGSSTWDCCPGRRTDKLEGTARGGKVQIARSCTGQGLSGRCLQVYEGEIAGDGSVSGSWSHNGRFAGKWRLEPTFPTRPPGPSGQPAYKISADPAPPYQEMPVTIDFALQAKPPTAGAVWWLDGRRMTNADVFFWTFGAAGEHEVELRDAADQVLAKYEVTIEDPGAERLWGRRRRSPGFGGVRNDLRELDLERSAAVSRVEGSASQYCIWTVGEGGSLDHKVVCGSEKEPITGAILLPGRYVVFPALGDDQRASEVTIHLRSR